MPSPVTEGPPPTYPDFLLKFPVPFPNCLLEVSLSILLFYLQFNLLIVNVKCEVLGHGLVSQPHQGLEAFPRTEARDIKGHECPGQNCLYTLSGPCEFEKGGLVFSVYILIYVDMNESELFSPSRSKKTILTLGGEVLPLVCLRQPEVHPTPTPIISQQDFRDIPSPAEVEQSS